MDAEALLLDNEDGEEEEDPLIRPRQEGEGEEEEEEQSTARTSHGGKCGHRLSSVITITACFFMLCVQGFDYTFGNINPYLTSYLRNVTNGGVDYTNTLWLFQTKSISSCVALPLFGLFANRMSPRLYMFIGVLFTAAYLFGTAYGLNRSFWVTWFTYGIVGGVPGAFIYPTCLKISAGWVPEKRGLVMGVNLMGYGVGSFMWNAMTTWYINGNNLQPDLHTGGDVYYTQSEVLDKVPSCFMVLGAVFTCMQLVCLVLIRIPPSCQVRTIKLSSVNDTEREISSDSQEHEQFLERPQTPDDDEEGGGKQDYHWKQVLKSRVFWTVWWMLLFSMIGVSFVVPLFKAFGQTFIADDHFLATVAMFSSICNAAGRPFWGLLADRFGPRCDVCVPTDGGAGGAEHPGHPSGDLHLLSRDGTGGLLLLGVRHVLHHVWFVHHDPHHHSGGLRSALLQRQHGPGRLERDHWCRHTRPYSPVPERRFWLERAVLCRLCRALYRYPSQYFPGHVQVWQQYTAPHVF